MRILKGIGFTIPSENDDFIKIDSCSSLSETDIAIFCPQFSVTSYSSSNNNDFFENKLHEGKRLYNKESSVNILLHAKHWRDELTHFVQNGGTLFVVLCKKEDFYIHSGTKERDNIIPYSNYNYLPLETNRFAIASGNKVLSCDNLVADFDKNFNKCLSYETYLTNEDEDIKKPIFTTKKRDRKLGEVLKMKDGFLVLLPNIELNLEELSLFNYDTEREYWTEEGIKIGKQLTNSLVEIDKSIRHNQEKSPQPQWLINEIYNLTQSEDIRKTIEQNDEEIARIKQENLRLTNILQEKESLKDLLFETGQPLELAVIKALRILGYKAENYDDGTLELDQIIISPEGDRLIGECEGKDNKDIDVSKFRQLQDGLNADFEREEVEEKAYGLLFGNPQRLVDPSDRNLDFTKKCKQGAERERIGLLCTKDLFDVCKYLIETEDIDFAETCRKAIIEQLGSRIVFPNCPHIGSCGS
jgi:hypothetical protein